MEKAYVPLLGMLYKHALKETDSKNAVNLSYWITEPKNDCERFEQKSKLVKIILEEFLTEFWGPRCDEYEGDCVCCYMWSLYDCLMKNPFEDEENDT